MISSDSQTPQLPVFTNTTAVTGAVAKAVRFGAQFMFDLLMATKRPTRLVVTLVDRPAVSLDDLAVTLGDDLIPALSSEGRIARAYILRSAQAAGARAALAWLAAVDPSVVDDLDEEALVMAATGFLPTHDAEIDPDLLIRSVRQTAVSLGWLARHQGNRAVWCDTVGKVTQALRRNIRLGAQAWDLTPAYHGRQLSSETVWQLIHCAAGYGAWPTTA